MLTPPGLAGRGPGHPGARPADPQKRAAQLLLYPATDPAMTSASITENGEGYIPTRHDMAWFYRQYLPGGTASAAAADLAHADVAGVAPAIVATAEFDEPTWVIFDALSGPRCRRRRTQLRPAPGRYCGRTTGAASYDRALADGQHIDPRDTPETHVTSERLPNDIDVPSWPLSPGQDGAQADAKGRAGAGEPSEAGDSRA